jgi:hypothetical protein
MYIQHVYNKKRGLPLYYRSLFCTVKTFITLPAMLYTYYIRVGLTTLSVPDQRCFICLRINNQYDLEKRGRSWRERFEGIFLCFSITYETFTFDNVNAICSRIIEL